MSDEKRAGLKRIRMVLMHGGPGPHKSGSPQSVHGGGKSKTSYSPNLRKDSSVTWGVAGSPENFEIRNGDAKVLGFIKADFTNDRTSPTRGEIFYTEVAEGSRRRGSGYAVTVEALEILRSKGMKTVNIFPTSEGGLALTEKLQREKQIGKLIRTGQSGKREYELLFPSGGEDV